MVDLASLLSDEDGDYRNKVKVSSKPTDPTVRGRNRKVLHEGGSLRACQSGSLPQEGL